MGEAKAKKSQVFRISLTGEQRKTLYDIFRGGAPELVKERDDRRRLARAQAAFALDDFRKVRGIPPKDPNDGASVIAAAEQYEALIASMEWTGTVTRENVDTAAKVIQKSMASGGWRPEAALILDEVEELLEQCADGKHAIDLEPDPEPAPVVATA